MAKINKPLLSLSAIGSLGKHLIFRRRGTGTVAQQTARPVDRRSFAQLQWRTMYQKAVALWHLLSPAEKESWERQATPRHMTGFAYFVSQALKPNPGIYLPLAGGTMQGDVDFCGHKILKLPSPTADEEPTRKLDLAAHAALPLAHVGIIPLFHVDKDYDNQILQVSTWTKLTWPRELFDSHGDFASNKFTPTIPGYYLFIGGFRILSMDADKRMLTALRRNGSLYAYLGQPHSSHITDLQIAGSSIAVANGSTDFFELWAWHNSVMAKSISGHTASTFFQGFRIVTA